MRHSRAIFLAATSVVFFACGGATPAGPHTTTLPTASATVSAPPPVDLSPVAMPPNAVVLIRVTHPASSADVLSDWAGQPLDAQGALTEMVGERIARMADLEAPADMLVLLKDRGGDREPDGAFAVALGVKNFEAAKSTLEGDYGLLPIGNGAFEIQRTSGHRDGDSDFRSCALAPSTSGGRIVCSRNATWRDDALPYLTRGTARFATVKSDVHVEARPGPLTGLVRRERARFAHSGSRFMDRELAGISSGAISDFVDAFLDTKGGTLDATIDSKRGTADLTITAGSSRALLTRVLSSHPERAEPPPTTFFRLPVDSDVAFFEHGVDADQIADPKALVLSTMSAAMDRGGKLAEADRRALLDVLGRTIDLTTAPLVYARGVDYAKAIAATSGLTEGSDAAKIKNGIEQAAGWDIVGVDAKPDRIAALLKDWAALTQRPSIAKTMDQDSFRVARAPRGAPPGTVELALRVAHEDYDWRPQAMSHGKPKKRPPFVFVLHTLVVPDHGTAWIVSALDEATAVAKARELVASSSSSTLASRAGLEPMKTAHVNAGGFVTPRGLGMGIPLSWLVASPRYKATTDPVLGISSPTQYTTPLLFTAAEAASGSDRSLTLSLTMPRAALADFLGVGPRIFH